MEQKIYFTLDYRELDELITDFLLEKGYNNLSPGYGYECIPENEWCNYQSHDGEVNGKVDQKEIDEWLEEEEIPSTFEILDWMAKEGKIKKGNYLIKIYW